MSEQEKSGLNADGSTLVKVEKSGEHKQPYRPTELEDEAHETQHKRARAPAVPMVPVELKPAPEGPHTSELESDRKEHESISSEISKSNAVKNMTTTKKWETQSDTLTIKTADIEMRSLVQQPPQPIPRDLEPVPAVPEKEALDQTEEDVIVQEPDAKYSGWPLKEGGYNMMQQILQPASGNNDISRTNSEYSDQIHLKTKGEGSSRSIFLERKSSIGPYKMRTPYAGASGLNLCVPKKSKRNFQVTDDLTNSAPVINITISKKTLSRRCRSGVETSVDLNNQSNPERRAVKVDLDIPYVKLITSVRNKISIFRYKMQNILHS